jgi:hypothetical protein
MSRMHVEQMVHQVRPRCRHQNGEAEEYTEGDEAGSQGSALSHRPVRLAPRPHQGYHAWAYV